MTAAVVVQPLVFVVCILPLLALSDNPPSFQQLIVMVDRLIVFAGLLQIFPGLPVFLALRRFGKVQAWSLAAAGFVIGAAPWSILQWPYGFPANISSSGSWFGRNVDFMIHGVPTMYGWLQYAEGTLLEGISGLAAGLAFFFTWRQYGSPAKA